MAKLEVLCGQVHARQHCADLRAVVGIGRELVAPGQLVDHCGRLAGQRVQEVAVGVGLRFGHRDAALREVAHQAQVEGQLLERQALEQGEHPVVHHAIAFGVDEEIAVLDAGLNAAKAHQPAQIQARGQCAGLGGRDLGKDGHRCGVRT